MSVPNFQLIAQFVQKLLRGSQNLEIRSRDPGHANLGAVASEAICKWGHNAGAKRKAPAEKILMCPLTFLLCPHMRGHNDCLLPTERQLNW